MQRRRRTHLVLIATWLAIVVGLLPAATPQARADGGLVTVDAAEEFTPSLVPGVAGDQPTADPSRFIASRPVGAGRDSGAPALTPTVPRGAPAGSLSLQTVDANEGVRALTYETDDKWSTLAVVGSMGVLTGPDYISMLPMADQLVGTGTRIRDFFNLPRGESWFVPTTAGSITRSRFVVAMPSIQLSPLDCSKSYLNVAVSRTANPMGKWYRYRIPVSDAYTDKITIGMSGDKVVLSTNQWDLTKPADGCLGSAWEGARLRVVDWADLLDGAGLTVRDVSPTPRTNYWSWVPAVNVPAATSTSTSNTVRLVGDRKVTTWGHLAYATITGSARKGTAKLVGNTDLTASRSIPELWGPPATILAMASGNGGLDERVISATVRGSQLYLTSHDQCQAAEDTDLRACARVIGLSLSTGVPTVIEDVRYLDPGQDTFLPFVGFARDGTVFLVMSRSSATSPEPTNHYIAYHDPGETFLDVPDEVLFDVAVARAPENPGDYGGIIPDPGNPQRVWAQFASVERWGRAEGRTASLVGNLTADPAGSFSLPQGDWTPAWGSSARLDPAADSPILWVRWSASPDVTDTAGGPMLTFGHEQQSGPLIGDNFADPELGAGEVDPYTVYVQWRTGDGRWSAPISRTVQVDGVAPVIASSSLRFAVGRVTARVPVRLAWSQATDDESGVDFLLATLADSGGPLDYGPLPPDTTSVGVQAHMGSRTSIFLHAIDNAGNWSDTSTSRFKIGVAQENDSSVRYSSGWSKTSGSSLLGKGARYATRSGAKAVYTFTGKAAAFVSTLGPNRGKAEIWVDGVKAATIDLKRSTTAYRRIVWQQRWDSSGAHKVVVKLLGTPGRPRVDVDAFLRF